MRPNPTDSVPQDGEIKAQGEMAIDKPSRKTLETNNPADILTFNLQPGEA